MCHSIYSRAPWPPAPGVQALVVGVGVEAACFCPARLDYSSALAPGLWHVGLLRGKGLTDRGTPLDTYIPPPLKGGEIRARRATRSDSGILGGKKPLVPHVPPLFWHVWHVWHKQPLVPLVPLVLFGVGFDIIAMVILADDFLGP